MIKPKPLNRRYAWLLIIAGVLFANAVTISVLDGNARAGLYPSHQDAIMVDIVFTMMNSMFILLPALISACLPRRHMLWRTTARILMLIAALYAFALHSFWSYPHHYGAGQAFIPVMVVCLWGLWIPKPPHREPRG